MPKWSREYLPSLILSGLVLVLALLGLVEWSFLQSDTRQNSARQDNRHPIEARQDSAAESPGFELPELEEFTATVERPLFAENRSPPAEDELEASAPAASTPLTLKLMGVIFTPRQQTVLMQDAKGKYKRMRRNDTLDGWTLAGIAGDRVTLRQGSEQKELMLLKPRPKPPVIGQGAQGQHAKPVIQEGGEEQEEEVDNTEEITTEDTPDEDQEATGE